MSPQGGSNSRPLVYETSALPLSYRGHHVGGGLAMCIYAVFVNTVTVFHAVLVQKAL